MKVSLKSQISAIDALTSGRIGIVAPSQSARSLVIDQLQAVALTLRLVQQHEAEIRAVVEAKSGNRR